MLSLFLHVFLHLFAALHRTQAVEPETGRAFPANGKIVVKFGGRSAEALLELPAPSTRDGAAELPAVVWLTVGLLATDTFALQVYTILYTFPKHHYRVYTLLYTYPKYTCVACVHEYSDTIVQIYHVLLLTFELTAVASRAWPC